MTQDTPRRDRARIRCVCGYFGNNHASWCPDVREGPPIGEWISRAACGGEDGDTFFPDDKASEARARRVCLSCPVRAECADYALSSGEPFGIWGGLTRRERAAVSA